MITMLITFFVAVVAGIVAGLLPGIGLLNTMIILWVFLSGLDAVNLLIFYVTLASITQFVGSVIATTTGVPGETSSIPASIEGPKLFNKNQGTDAIAMAAIGSFFGTAVVGAALLFLLPYVNGLALHYYSNTVQTMIFLFVFLLILFTTSNKFYVNVLLMLFGIGLALIGSDILSGGSGSTIIRVNFGIDDLKQGIPLEILAISIIAIPQVLRHLVDISYQSIPQISKTNFTSMLKKYIKYSGAGARGTLVGIATGMIPGAAHTMSSLVAYQSEKFLRTKKKIYSHSGDMHSLVSAETANNAGVLISMIPVFLFGIPILGSEAVLINLVEMSGVAVGFGTLAAREFFMPTVIFFLLSGILGTIVAWQGANGILNLFKIPSYIIRSVLILVLVATVLYVGSTSYNLIYYIVLLCVLTPIGILLKRYDLSIVIFSFLIFPMLEGSLIRFAVLNF